MVVECLPNPRESQKERMNTVVYGSKEKVAYRNEAIEKAISACNQTGEVETTAFISKMVAVPVEFLPSNRRVQFTSEQLRERRRQKLAEQMAQGTVGEDGVISLSREPSEEGSTPISPPSELQEGEVAPAPAAVPLPQASEVFVGFGRVFSGSLKKGQEIYVLGPKYNPQDQTQHIAKVKVESLFLLMGRDLEELEEVPAGNIFGVLGLGEHILKTATLSTTPNCPSFGQLHFEVSPILRVALEPANPCGWLLGSYALLPSFFSNEILIVQI